MDDPTQAAETAEDTKLDAAEGAAQEVQEASSEAEALPVAGEAAPVQEAAPAPQEPASDPHSDPADGEISKAGTDTEGGDPAFAAPADDDAGAGDDQVDQGPAPVVTEIDPDLAELNAGLARMQHRDGNGSCDLYEKDAEGFLLVPLNEVQSLFEHGFEIFYGEDS